MPSKKKASSAEALRVSILLADDIRAEVGGKLTAIGIYTDRVLLTNFDGKVTGGAPTQKSVMAVGHLAAAFTVGGLSKGTHTVSLFYLDPTMERQEPVKVRETIVRIDGPQQAFNLIGRFAPFMTAGFGEKMFDVQIDGKSHFFSFAIRSADQKGVPVAFIEKPVKPVTPSVAPEKKAPKRWGASTETKGRTRTTRKPR